MCSCNRGSTDSVRRLNGAEAILETSRRSRTASQPHRGGTRQPTRGSKKKPTQIAWVEVDPLSLFFSENRLRPGNSKNQARTSN